MNTRKANRQNRPGFQEIPEARAKRDRPGGFRDMPWASRSLSLIATIGLAVGLSGCAGAHLYNAENDATAAAALKASGELDLVGVITQERQNQAKLLEHEIALVSDYEIALRDNALQGLLESSQPISRALSEAVRNRHEELVGGADPKEIPSIERNVVEADENLASAEWDFRDNLQVAAPDCRSGSAAYAVSPDRISEIIEMFAKKHPNESADFISQFVADNFGRVQGYCEEYFKALDKFPATLGTSGAKPEVREAYNAWSIARAKVAQREQDKDAKLAELNADLKAIKPLPEKAGGISSEAAQKAFKESLGKVQEILKDLQKLPLAQIEVATQQIEAIDEVLAAAASGTASETTDSDKQTPNKERLVKLAAQLPSLVGHLASIDALRTAPPVAALVFEKQRLQALKQDAERRVAREKQRLALRKGLFDALVREVEVLNRVRRLLDGVGRQIRVADLMGQRSGGAFDRARRTLVEAIGTYLSTFSGPQRAVFEAEYRLIDVDHAEILDRSETALTLWETAVKQPVTVLAAYHGSGVRPEDLIEILKATGLFAIAGGVSN